MTESKPALDFVNRLAELARCIRRQPELPPGWRSKVMQEINTAMDRDASRIWAEQNTRTMANLWLRFAGGAGLAALALSLYALFFGPDLESQTAGFLLNYSGWPLDPGGSLGNLGG